MEPTIVENQLPNVTVSIPPETPVANQPTIEAPVQATIIAAPAVVDTEATDVEKKEETTNEEMKTEQTAEETATYQEEEEEEEEEIPEPEEEEWISEEETTKPRRRGRRSQMSESEDDEEYGRSKRRKIIPIKKVSRPRTVLTNEPAGMKALRQYTSALKLGPRCFRGLNKISNVKEREAQLISRLHDCGRSWDGEYPTEEDIMLAKEETRQKKAEKAKQYIIEEEDGVRSSRKAAQKARDFVKNLGEDDEEEPVNEELDAEVEPEIEETKDEE